MNMYSEHKHLLTPARKSRVKQSQRPKLLRATTAEELCTRMSRYSSAQYDCLDFSIMPCKTKITTMHPTMPEPAQLTL
jgi:hypothetical protein